MKRLKILRQEHKYTQQQLAKMLKTTQQSIARWETGKAEPSVSALRDLAMIFGTSVDDLLGKNPFSNKVASTMLHVFGKNAVADGFWGHIGLLMHGQPHTKWFPITIGTANRFSDSVSNVAQDGEWLCLPTLNNRMLAINPAKIMRIWLLDDACDEPDDWSDEALEDYEGNPLEVYRGVDTYFSAHDDDKGTSSTTYQEIIEEFVKKKGLDEEKAVRLLHYTTIYMADGAVTAYWAEPERLYDIVADIEIGGLQTMLYIPEFGGGFESYYPATKVAVIDMPLIDIMDATNLAHADWDDDSEAKEAPGEKPPIAIKSKSKRSG